MRVGMTFDDKMIYAYQYENLAYATMQRESDRRQWMAQTVPIRKSADRRPAGDNYLYAHYQFDTQASYKLPWGFQVMPTA